MEWSKQMRNLKVSLLLFLVSLTPILFTTKVYAAVPTVNRLSGADRYDTNINIIKNGWTEAPYVVIASGENYPDALCAAPFAEAKNAPILLTNGIALSNSAVEQLSRLNTKEAYIIGGTGVISSSVEAQLNSLGITCTRLAGQNRYETSVKVAEQLGTENGIAVASGENFPDALSIAPIAAKQGMPILLSLKTSLPDSVCSYLKDKDIPVSYIIGGVGVLNTDVKNSLKNPKRLGGMSRYETNISVIREFQDSVDYDIIYAASGQNFPDALSGSVLAGNSNSPIVLMDNSLSEVTSDYLKEQNCKTINILGGTGAVSSDAESTVKNTMEFLNIVKVDNISDTAYIGEDYHFPDTVLATYEDSSTKLVPVKWDAGAVDTSKAGQYAFDGNVQGYSGKAHMDLNVGEEVGTQSRIAYYKGSIYYIDKDRDKLYKLEGNSSKGVKLNDEQFISFVIEGDHIYYIKEFSSDSDTGIYRMNLDGSGVTKFVDGHINTFAVVGDWIYYCDYSYPDTQASVIYKMKTDGTNRVKVTNGWTEDLIVQNGYIYYINGIDGKAIYKMRTDGSENTKICSDSSASFRVADGWIYYRAVDGTLDGPDEGPGFKIYKIREDGTQRTKLSDNFTNSVDVYDDWIYYSNRSDNNKLYRMRKDGSDNTMLVDSSTFYIDAIIGDWVFYRPNIYGNALFAVRLDGSGYHRFETDYRNENEPNNTLEAANDLNPEQDFGDAKAIKGELNKGDVDYFLFVPQYSGYRYLDVVLSAPNMGENAVITLTDVYGNPLYSVKTGYDGTAAFSVNLTSPETYYLKISSQYGDLIEDGGYSLLTWYQYE